MEFSTDFQTACSAVFAQIGDHEKFVLATSLNNHTTARMMTCIIIKQNIYMQTDTKFEKYAQMKANPQVALCSNNIQIEGTASFLGHPLSQINAEFAQLLKKYYVSTYENYSQVSSNVLVKITPTKLTLWNYEAASPYRNMLDFVNKKAYNEEYKI